MNTNPSLAADLSFTVKVAPLVPEDLLEEDDREAEGDYEITLGPEATSWTTHQQAEAVLDQFHSIIPIGMLDDFEITVFNGQGQQIQEDHEFEEHPSLDFIVRVKPRVEPKDVNEADRQAEGDYPFTLPGRAAGWPKTRQEEKVLDIFHATTSIRDLEHFDIQVLWPGEA